ncbi:MAG: Invasion protein InvA [Chlamydiae bacterium]|nr:Invasion protein InvA [Chlamydiota bacterium]
MKFLGKLGSQRALKFVTHSSDLVLAFFIIAIIAMFVIPMPPDVIDFLISINFAISVSLIFVSLFIRKATDLSIFPSLLLITTLYRLGVNISSSKQILLNAYAGEVIEAFGLYVVGGNYVVGGVIFLIITIVQFIVIVKGAERVAEVAARFVLDAMPGKQMSIDADLRAGTIDSQQARNARLVLQKESQLYGAMDGAMKFVKGDAIAGIVIALINIVGGLIIGITMHGMTPLQAAHTYTILSVGDGLVSQIPALIIALTAGIVTTRVASEEKEANLGSDIFKQIVAFPKGILLGAGFTLLIGLVPHFPLWPFAIMSTILFSIGIYFYREQKRQQGVEKAGSIEVATSEDGKSTTYLSTGEDYALTVPVMLEAGKMVSELIRKDRGGQNFVEEMIPKMRNALYQDLGVRFPGVHVRTDSLTLKEDEYMILLNEVPIVRGKIVPDHILSAEPEEVLQEYNIPYTTQINALNLPSLWIDVRYLSVMDDAKLRYWQPLNVVILHLSYFFRNYSSEFIGIQEVRGIIEFVERSFPDVIKEVTRLVPLQKLTEIFKRLVQEQISIKDLRTIMEALAEWAQSEKDTVLLTEYVRSSLKRYISNKYSQGTSFISVYVLDPEIEDMVRGAIKQTSAGSYLALDGDSVQLILNSMRKVIKPPPPGAQPPVILTAMDVRRFVRKLIESEFPTISVLSVQEIIPEIRIQPLGKVQLT